MAARPLIAVFTGLLLVAGLFFVITADGCSQSAGDGRETVTIHDEVFHLTIVADDTTRSRGLGGVTSLDADGGMLFVFDSPGLQSFWMKDCLIDIDLIFLDPRGRITALHEMPAIEPRGATESELQYEARLRISGQYDSRLSAVFAIELQTGSLDRLGLAVGEKIELDTIRLQSLTAR